MIAEPARIHQTTAPVAFATLSHRPVVTADWLDQSVIKETIIGKPFFFLPLLARGCGSVTHYLAGPWPCCLTGLTSQYKDRLVTVRRHSILHFLFSDVRAEILQRVLRSTTPEAAANCFGRAIARETGLALRTVQEELDKLEKTGLLNSHKEQTRRVYCANRENPLFAPLKRLFAAANCPRHFRSHHRRPNQRWRWSITHPKG